MADNQHTFEIPDDHLASFLACLAIGTLQAIRDGALSTEAGIWSLAPPRLWQPLAGKSARVDQVIEILRACDELSAIEEALPAGLQGEIDELIARLRAVVAGHEPWQAAAK